MGFKDSFRGRRRDAAGHDHAGHDHAGHDHAGHDHAGHDHAGHPPPPAGEVPHGDEPGASSTPLSDGEGTVGLADRGAGSPGSNQGKSEAMPPGPGHAEPATGSAATEPPELAEMNVGAADPQAPAHPAARPGMPLAGDPGDPGDPAGETAQSRPAAGTAQRAPGSLGTTGPDEQLATDVAGGANRMREDSGLPQDAAASGRGQQVPRQQAPGGGQPGGGQPGGGQPGGGQPGGGQPGSGQGVPVTSSTSLAGSSEDQPAVSGVRAPADDEAGPESST